MNSNLLSTHLKSITTQSFSPLYNQIPISKCPSIYQPIYHYVLIIYLSTIYLYCTIECEGSHNLSVHELQPEYCIIESEGSHNLSVHELQPEAVEARLRAAKKTPNLGN